MKHLKISLTPELLARLTAIAGDQELSVEDCAHQALLDYIESWEEFERSIDAIEAGEEERTVLKTVTR